MPAINESTRRSLRDAILLLFLFQLLADFVEAVYAFGLLGTSIPPEIVAVLVLFAPAGLLAWRRATPAWLLPLAGAGLVAARLLSVTLDTRGRMIAAGVGVGFGLVWLGARLLALSRQADSLALHEAVAASALGLLGAVGASIALRAVGSGSDVSTVGAGQAIAWLLAAVALALLRPASADAPPSATGPAAPPTAWYRLLAPVLGVYSVLLLLYFAFTAPNVMARWTGAPYLSLVVTVTVSLALFALVVTGRQARLATLPDSVYWMWNGAFVVALLLAIAPHQIAFPGTVDAYPLPEPAVGAAAWLPLYAALILAPVLVVDWARFTGAIARRRPSPRALGGAMTLGSVYLLLLIFGHVFTTVYDYIPVVGPFFRDKFWLVHLVPGFGLFAGLVDGAPVVPAWGKGRVWRIALPALGVVAVAGALAVAARPGTPLAPDAVRVLTYNIQQGYSAAGSKNYAGQLDLIRSLEADIIGLQESDTNRIAGGNDDVVRTFADALDMHSYYGPKSVPGTFGIALLSKYPIEDARTFYMFSEGEQTATIEATVQVGDRRLRVYVTHLGNGGPAVQQVAILEALGTVEDVVLMGDFNFRPDSAQYAATTAVLDDAWTRPGVERQSAEPDGRIDHIFVSADVAVTEMRYIEDPASDHPAALAVIEP